MADKTPLAHVILNILINILYKVNEVSNNQANITFLILLLLSAPPDFISLFLNLVLIFFLNLFFNLLNFFFCSLVLVSLRYQILLVF